MSSFIKIRQLVSARHMSEIHTYRDNAFLPEIGLSKCGIRTDFCDRALDRSELRRVCREGTKRFEADRIIQVEEKRRGCKEMPRLNTGGQFVCVSRGRA
jgi:hypothetical protein